MMDICQINVFGTISIYTIADISIQNERHNLEKKQCTWSKNKISIIVLTYYFFLFEHSMGEI